MEVGIEDVNGVNLEPFEALLNTLLDVLSVGVPFRIHICIISSMDFSGDHDLFSGDFEVLKDFSELDLRCSRGIDFGSVEEIDAILESELNYFFVLLVAFRFAVDHVAEGDG